jgi:hypothetical protein
MDFITGLPKSKGTNVIMETIQKLLGNPKIIVSDRDPILTNNFWTDLFSRVVTQLGHNYTYHPQYN